MSRLTYTKSMSQERIEPTITSLNQHGESLRKMSKAIEASNPTLEQWDLRVLQRQLAELAELLQSNEPTKAVKACNSLRKIRVSLLPSVLKSINLEHSAKIQDEEWLDTHHYELTENLDIIPLENPTKLLLDRINYATHKIATDLEDNHGARPDISRLPKGMF
jgi:hypothetical protein